MMIVMICHGCQSGLKPSDTTTTRTTEYQQQIDDLLARDAENKRWARIYLQEIDAAIANDDMLAYVFFVNSYEQTPLEIVPQWLRHEPGYVHPPGDLELYFRLRWFEQAVLLYKKMSTQPIKPNHL